MKTVILTGGTGFIGAAVLRELRLRGLAVVVLKRSTSDTRRIADVLVNDASVTSYDVDTVTLQDVFSHHPIEVVIHVATDYARTTESLSRAVESNVLFPTRLLEAAAASGATAFINTDTFSAKAQDLPQGLDAYVLTKKHFRQCGEMLAARHGLRFVNLRIEHAYGPGDGAGKFVPPCCVWRVRWTSLRSHFPGPGGSRWSRACRRGWWALETRRTRVRRRARGARAGCC